VIAADTRTLPTDFGLLKNKPRASWRANKAQN
jgi:hypothetical protein